MKNNFNIDYNKGYLDGYSDGFDDGYDEGFAHGVKHTKKIYSEKCGDKLKEQAQKQEKLLELYREYRSDIIGLIKSGEGVATYHYKSKVFNKIKVLEMELENELD